MSMDEVCRLEACPTSGEIDHFEWSLASADSWTPGQLSDRIDEFVSQYRRTRRHDTVTDAELAAGFGSDEAPLVCGVSLHLSAAAGAYLAGGATGAPSPVPQVPDVVLIAHAHSPTHTPTQVEPTVPTVTCGPWTRTLSQTQHGAAVEAIQAAIAAGDVYVANMVGHWSCDYFGPVQPIVDAVVGVDGAIWGGAMAGEDWVIASASPECFFTVKDGILKSYPIKGTAADTEAGLLELTHSVKERAEHAMIVDLMRNDMASVSVAGSVSVDEFFTVHRWLQTIHAQSQVSSILVPDLSVSHLLSRMCPPGSVTGTPKLEVLELLAQLEPVGRGPAMGVMGFVANESSMELGLTIRTVAIIPSANKVHLWAGGGITWRSDPIDEAQEAATKAQGVMNAISKAVVAAPVDF